MNDTSNSGIYVVEGLARGQAIPVDGESVTAFVGPAPRGPVDHAVRISNAAQFQKIFGIPECHCRMEFAVRQFFANGGSNAAVVRISGTAARNQIRLPGDAGMLILEARNPGPLESLRASVDYDGIRAEDGAQDADTRFNIILQRLRTPGSAWIDAQEYYRNVSIDPASRDYLGYVLSQSEMAYLTGTPPLSRPWQTIKPATMRESGYVDSIPVSVSSPPPIDYDLIGSTRDGTGLSALENIPDIGQICLISGSADAAIGPVAMLAADRFCREHQALLIVDPPARWQSVDDVLNDQERSGFSSPNAVTWFPAVRTRNAQNEGIAASMAGAVAAVLSPAQHVKGVHNLHAGGPVMLRGDAYLTAKVDQPDVRRLARAGVNSLIQRSPLHIQLLGDITQARHTSLTGQWNALKLRQEVLFILRRIRHGTHWTSFHQSTPELWQDLSRQVAAFLAELHARSVLVGEHAEKSFFVRCDADTNAGVAGRDGEIAFVVGFALRRPDEFLAFRLQCARGACRISQLGWQSDVARAS